MKYKRYRVGLTVSRSINVIVKCQLVPMWVFIPSTWTEGAVFTAQASVGGAYDLWLLNNEASFKTELISEITVATCVIIPYNAVSIGSYALWHVIIPFFEACPEVILWDCFRCTLPHSLHTPSIKEFKISVAVLLSFSKKFDVYSYGFFSWIMMAGKLHKNINKLILDTPWTKRCVVWHSSLGRYSGNYCVCKNNVQGQGCARSIYQPHALIWITGKHGTRKWPWCI